jgi:CheY-like chemotaxis protein
MAVEPSEVRLSELRDYVNRNFRHVADGKALEFGVEVSPELPKTVFTDLKRLQQVLKNLLSNALKFTEQGRVSLTVHRATSGWQPGHPVLDNAGSVVAFSVQDTGIGISPDKQRIIFEAFQQADGTTSRKYGGTGLGLSISREIAHLLGGEIRLKSTPGEGSEFTLYLPQTYFAGAAVVKLDSRPIRRVAPPAEPTQFRARTVPDVSDQEDDRESIAPGDRLLLIVEDDATYSRIVSEHAHQNGFKVIVATRGDLALAMARKFRPAAVLLDIGLPDTTGWTVLDQLKHDPGLRHIPVHVLSVSEEKRRGLSLGACSYFTKSETPEALDAVFGRVEESVSGDGRAVLLVSTDEPRRRAIEATIGAGDFEVVAAQTQSEAIHSFDDRAFDCIIVDVGSPDLRLADIVSELQERESDRALPVIVFGASNAPERDVLPLGLRENVVLHFAGSPERLLEEITKLLHVPEAALPEDKRLQLERVRQVDQDLAGSRVLIVDDDVRNIFALTSILERHDIEVLHAENGRAGIDTLMHTPGIDIVLMDIMMPGMDGYETIRAIRDIDAFRTLPIIAVTAKAMKGDREKCIESGASDYIPKPVDLDQLFSLMRVWMLDRRQHAAALKA